ncbi:MAG: nitrous oxide-stimulated promoter family protein [Phycisphaera sp.]|nr:nitrous oxide-stimulated promoter family protein [Phycisphaera sp.]
MISQANQAVRSPRMEKDLKTLARFIELYCHDHHSQCELRVVSHDGVDLAHMLNHDPKLCPECENLLAYSFQRRIRCIRDPKPECKHCPKHCYKPEYRQRIRSVMAYSGRKFVLRGRIDYLLHLFF